MEDLNIEKYEKALLQDPNSRLFAPLANSYRKLSFYDKAIPLLKRGIEMHPSYISGYLVLAECYFDRGEYHEAFKILDPFFLANKENLKFLKIYGEINLKLKNYERALDVYRTRLFLKDQDKIIPEKILEIEKEINLLKNPEKDLEFFFQEKIDLFSDWSAINLSNNKIEAKEKIEKVEEEVEEVEEVLSTKEDHPITSTLLDIYLDQGNLEKSQEICTKMLEIDPEDKEIKLKHEKVNKLIESQDSLANLEHEKLLDIVHEKVKNS